MKPRPIVIGSLVAIFSGIAITGLVLVIVGWWLQRDFAHVNNPEKDSSVGYAYYSIVPTSPAVWKEATFQVYSTKKPGASTVQGRIWNSVSVFMKHHGEHYDVPPTSSVCPMTVFVTESGEVWAQMASDFYIETESGVVGGKLRDRDILWYESMIPKPPFERIAIDEVVKRFEKKLQDDSRRTPLGPSSESLGHGSRRATKTMLIRPEDHNMENRLSERFQLVKTHQVLQVTGNTLHLALRSNCGRTLNVSTDISSKKLLKAEENGKQVYPKSPWPW